MPSMLVRFTLKLSFNLLHPCRRFSFDQYVHPLSRHPPWHVLSWLSMHSSILTQSSFIVSSSQGMS